MSQNFQLLEATIAEIHSAMRSGDLTSEELVERYCSRIEAYDRNGPKLNSIITVNSDAVERAAQLDAKFDQEGLVGPLHGIPILVKDQAMTSGLRTTFGSEAFKNYVPKTDATIISKLKHAGAIILAKTNLPDWASGAAGYSSILGQTKNPYALDRDPGGSSAGTGAAIAANLGTVGIGEDTGGSIRVPASCCNLFGIRMTTGLISRFGLSPLIERQDTPGPMARTVEDMARLLDVLVGYDSEDTRTSVTEIAGDKSYLDPLDTNGLDNARIGVLRQAFNIDGDDEAAQVTSLVEDGLDSIINAGAELVDPVSIPDLDAKLEETWLYALQSRHDLDSFLSDLEDPPFGSFDELYESGMYYDEVGIIETMSDASSDPTTHLNYWQKVAAQDDLQRDILSLHAEHNLDAIVFPDIKVAPRPYERLQSDEDQEEYLTNTYIASQSSCPAVSMPGGFTDNGLPVGIELVGPPYSEQQLLSMASDYESVTNTRHQASTAPKL